jgi:hypothetical protein
LLLGYAGPSALGVEPKNTEPYVILGLAAGVFERPEKFV